MLESQGCPRSAVGPSAMCSLMVLLCSALLAIGQGCAGDGPAVIALTEETGGPEVRWDVLALPLPEIPLPNDAATRLDPTSPTGRRLNISLEATTRFERRMRDGFDTLDGFGTYAPILVQFDAPLDLKDLWERHNGGPWPQGGESRDDFRDDAVFLLNVDPTCDRFGEEIALDIGRGRYPVVVDKKDTLIQDPDAPEGLRVNRRNILFEHDPLGHLNNLLFAEREEDVNGDGELSPEEDRDHDGVWDRPNFMEPDGCASHEAGSTDYDRCVADQLLTFYDRQDDTLILRPLWPMEERCTHAMVLTKRLVGEDGKAVQSPFQAVHAATQERALRPMVSLLDRYDVSPTDVAFAWSFTTGTMTRDLDTLRDGLYGHGPFARLADEFPTEIRWIPSVHEAADGGLLEPGGCAGITLTTIWANELVGIGEWLPNMCSMGADYNGVGGLAWGWFEAPNLMVDRDGLAHDAEGLFQTAEDLLATGEVEEGLEVLADAHREWLPADNDERWEMDARTGEATYGRTRVPIWCAIPRDRGVEGCVEGNPDRAPFCKPYPTVLFSHGYTGSRQGMQDFLGRTTSMGYVACATDAYGHGKNLYLQTGETEVYDIAIEDYYGYGTSGMAEMMLMGRDRDLNNDGLADPGGDFWTADLFHTRDMLRQTVLEYMQLVRILRSFDGTAGPDGTVAGDLDGDGTVDFGGPQSTIGMWGVSLGGIVAGILKGAEPSLDAVSPNAGGAGLTDIGARSTQAGVPEAVHLPIMGLLIHGEMPWDEHQNPLEDSSLTLSFKVNDRGEGEDVVFGDVAGVQPGDRVVLTNLDNGEEAWARVSPRGDLRIAVAVDALGPIERRPLLGLEPGQTGPVEVEDTSLFGDRLRLVFSRWDTDEEVAVVDTFPVATTFQGTTYPAGSTLVALQEGLGHHRNSPDYRRFLSIAQHALDPADPAIWSAHAATRTRAVSLGEEADLPEWKRWRNHMLVMPTVGDMQVPVNTGIAEGRTAGLLGSWFRDEAIGPEHGWRALFVPDDRWGHTADQELLERFVVEGVERLGRFDDLDPPLPHPRVLYDVENLSDGTARWSCLKEQTQNGDWDDHDCPAELVAADDPYFHVPSNAPESSVRATVERDDGTWDGMRIPMLRPTGQHGIYNAQPFRPFDMDTQMVNLTLRFLGSGGREFTDHSGCDCSTSYLPQWEVSGEVRHPELAEVDLSGPACTEADLNLCDDACSAAWGFLPDPGPSTCP